MKVIKLLTKFRRQNCDKKYFSEGLKNYSFYSKEVYWRTALMLGSRMV